LAGLAVPIWHWKSSDQEISAIKRKYSLDDAEIHTAWMVRKYLEQTKIPSFSSLQYPQRRTQVSQQRKLELLRLQRSGNPKHYKQTKKNYIKTNDYIHLTLDERIKFIEEIAQCVSNWGFARLFAECVDKIHFDPIRAPSSLDEQAFSQIVSRFEQYLQNESSKNNKNFGLLIHDNNETVARKHTEQMKYFHKQGTIWTNINNIIETPLFVDSKLTSLIQIADLCSYALRRYLENDEKELFALIFNRAHRKGNTAVGVRHFTDSSCSCDICSAHSRS